MQRLLRIVIVLGVLCLPTVSVAKKYCCTRNDEFGTPYDATIRAPGEAVARLICGNSSVRGGKCEHDTQHHMKRFIQIGKLYGIGNRDAGKTTESWSIGKLGTGSGFYRVTTGNKNRDQLVLFDVWVVTEGRRKKLARLYANKAWKNFTKSHMGFEFELKAQDYGPDSVIEIDMEWKGTLSVHDGGLFTKVKK